MLEKETYTQEEVDRMINPLLKQITFYSNQSIKLKKFIRKIHMFSFLRKREFLQEIYNEEDQSKTVMFDNDARASYFRLRFKFLK